MIVVTFDPAPRLFFNNRQRTSIPAATTFTGHYKYNITPATTIAAPGPLTTSPPGTVVLHAELWFPSLADDELVRSQLLPDQIAVARIQQELTQQNGSALQEQMLAMLVLLQLCCVSAQSSAALVKLLVLGLLLDLLILFRNSTRHAQWQVNVLVLLQVILELPMICRALAASQPLLTRYMRQLVVVSPSVASSPTSLSRRG
jgi:hypothetical protein